MAEQQGSSDSPSRLRSYLLAFAASVLALAVGLYLAVGMSGPSPDWVRFLGRFHPLVVHLPVGVLLLVVLAEGASLVPAARRRFDPVVTPLLVVLVASGMGAFTLGILLASDGGYPTHLVSWHRGLTLAAVAGSAVALGVWSMHRTTVASAYRHAYRVALGLTLGVLAAGAHFGGSMTHGEDYLVRYAPGPLRWMMGGGPPPEVTADRGEPASEGQRDVRVYADLIQPVLRDKCSECHGASKTKGGLNLLSLAALQQGGESGPAFVAGSADQSPIMRRLRLPEGHDDRMPPAGKPAPTDAEIALLGWWIERGADADVTVRELLPPEPVRQLLERAAAGSTPRPPSRAVSVAGEETSTDDSDTDADADADAETSAVPEDPDEAPAPAPQVVAGSSGRIYADHVAPILGAYCTGCHGSEKQKGKLRVDTIAGLRRGGAGGPAIIARNAAASPIVRRMRLGVDHDDHMPPATRPQPSPDHVALIAFWIDQGATDDLAVAALPPALARTRPVTATAPATAGTTEAETSGEVVAGSGSIAGTTAPTPVAWEPSAGAVAALGLPPRLPKHVTLYRDAVAPVLDLRCGGCHLGEPLMGGYSVGDPVALVAAGSVVPGHPEQSEMFRRITLPIDHEGHMPPPQADQPPAQEIALIRYWIATGASSDAAAATADLPPLVAHAVAEHMAAEAAASEPAADAPAVTPVGAVEPRSGGCASCAVGARSSSSGWWLLASSFFVVLGSARRRSRLPTS